MIIKNDQRPSKTNVLLKRSIPLLLVLALTFYWLAKKSKSKGHSATVSTSMEKVKDNTFVNGQYIFQNGHTRSNEYPRTGKYSSKLDAQRQYGPRYDLTTVNEGDQLCASIWRSSPVAGNGYLAFQGNQGSDFMMQTNVADETDQNGWDKLNLCVTIPNNNSLSSIKVFPYSLNKTAHSYFDDFEIKYISKDSLKSNTLAYQTPNLSLYIDPKNYKKLEDARTEAFKYGILVNDGTYANAKLKDENQTQKVKIRLKGDWTDHLLGTNWSYRIKTASDNAWNRMQTFSLQSPERRFFAHEWLFHNFLQSEDILTTKYDFVKLKLNDRVSELYAYEEHFDKHLPESNSRREGVLLKFTEDAAWEQRIRSKKAVGHHDAPLINPKYISDIEPFRASRIVKDSSLLKQFNEAQELMYAYKHNLQPAENIFDLDKMARYYAIVEILRAYHSMVWHNHRFYYNPVSRKLEPVGYDGFIENGTYDIVAKDNCFGFYKSNKYVDDWAKYYSILYRNKTFASKFAAYLNKYSSPEFIENYLNEIKEDLDSRVHLINQYYPEYNLNKKEIYTKCKTIQASLPAMNNISLKAFVMQTTANEKILNVSNYHHLPIEIIGSGNEVSANPTSLNPLEQNLWSNHPNKAPEYKSISVPTGDNVLYFKVLGLDQIHFTQIKNWPSAHKVDFTKKAVSSLQVPFESQDVKITKDQIILLSGKYVVTQPIKIPREMNFIIEPGTSLDLTNKAYILSESRIHFKGTKENPIHIYSSDKSGQGLLVLNAQGKSSLNHCKFSELDNLDLGNYFMTGAVSFYESDVSIKQSQFSSNYCEDALNIIRSNFDIDYIFLADTYSDGFDADFCTGTIKNSLSQRTGNDAFDFSGSTITVENCTFENISDKAISAGEQATITVDKAYIDVADIGIASKDLSKVTVKYASVSNCNKAFAAYQKKPEYGPGKINILKFEETGNKYLELKEDNSEIIFP